jgi:hypothetical protein
MSDIAIVALISLLGGVAAGILGLWTAAYTGKVELKKRKPEQLTHQCRLWRHDVYTFTTGSKKQTPPACPYLDVTDYITCQFPPGEGDLFDVDVYHMKRVNEGKCYLACFSREFSLE